VEDDLRVALVGLGLIKHPQQLEVGSPNHRIL